MKRFSWLAGLLPALVIGGGAQAQAPSDAMKDFGTKPIKVIVPFTAGSGSDTSSRFFGEQLAAALKTSAVIENKPGGNGIVALQQVKQAPADGHTIILASNSPMAVNPAVMKDLPYDPIKDFRPVSGLTRGMNVMLVPNESKIRTPADLMAAAKSAPKGFTVATYSAGYHLAAEWLASLAGARFINVPYKGQAPIMTDLIGGQLEAALVDMGGAVPLLKEGKMRAVAVSGESRHPYFPDVPTWKESGFPSYVQYSWVSFYVRAQTPDDVTERLSATLAKVMASAEAREFVKRTGGELMPLNAQQMQRFHREELERFQRIATSANIKPE